MLRSKEKTENSPSSWQRVDVVEPSSHNHGVVRSAGGKRCISPPQPLLFEDVTRAESPEADGASWKSDLSAWGDEAGWSRRELCVEKQTLSEFM